MSLAKPGHVTKFLSADGVRDGKLRYIRPAPEVGNRPRRVLVNPIVIIAIIAQSMIARTNRMAGAIAGFVLTTGILIWGLSLYRQGSGIALLGFPLSQPIFLVVCLVWYGFNTKSFLTARQIAAARAAQTVQFPQAPDQPQF